MSEAYSFQFILLNYAECQLLDTFAVIIIYPII